MSSVSRCGQGYMMGFGSVAIIRVGSCVEGGIIYSSDPECSLMDLDELRVLLIFPSQIMTLHWVQLHITRVGTGLIKM